MPDLPLIADTVGEWGGEQVPYILANAGIDIILCNAPNLYLDFAYNKHPQEPGLYWGGWVNERNTYDLLPLRRLPLRTHGHARRCHGLGQSQP